MNLYDIRTVSEGKFSKYNKNRLAYKRFTIEAQEELQIVKTYLKFKSDSFESFGFYSQKTF